MFCGKAEVVVVIVGWAVSKSKVMRSKNMWVKGIRGADEGRNTSPGAYAQGKKQSSNKGLAHGKPN